MRVLVTGHAGYIGSVLVPIVQAAGHQAVGFDTGYFCDCGFDLSQPNMPEKRKDIRSVEREDVAGCEAVIHLAALCNDPLGDLNPGLTDEINHRASIRLAEIAREVGVRRFLFASSCSMYGAGDGPERLTEQAPLAPLTPYAQSKVQVEAALAEMADDVFSPVYLRNATVYGSSPRLRGDVVLNNLVGWAYTTGRVRIMSDGTPWRPLVHVEDVARAFVACLKAPIERIHNEAFNIGQDSENYQVRDLGEIVRATVPGSIVEYAGQTGPDPRNYRVDFSKVTRCLPEFRPVWTAQAGARQLYSTLKEYRVDRETFLGQRFVRLAHIRRLLDTGALDQSLRWAGGGHS